MFHDTHGQQETWLDGHFITRMEIGNGEFNETAGLLSSWYHTCKKVQFGNQYSCVTKQRWSGGFQRQCDQVIR